MLFRSTTELSEISGGVNIDPGMDPGMDPGFYAGIIMYPLARIASELWMDRFGGFV